VLPEGNSGFERQENEAAFRAWTLAFAVGKGQRTARNDGVFS